MLIPLGFLAASGVSAGSFDLLETQTLTGSQSSVTFSSLSTYATTYQHLQIRAVARTSNASAGGVVFLDFNGSSSGTIGHYLLGDGSSASGDDSESRAGFVTGANATTSAFGAIVLDLLDPFETTKNKTFRALSGPGIGIYLASGMWVNTSAVTSLTLRSSANFVQYSRFSLYGIKAA